MPSLSLETLQVGVDNLRHDVYLSPKFVESARLQIAHRIARHGEVDTLLSMETAVSRCAQPFFRKVRPPGPSTAAYGAAELKPLLADMLIASLTKAKMKGSLSVDVLGRLAILKFLRPNSITSFRKYSNNAG